MYILNRLYCHFHVFPKVFVKSYKVEESWKEDQSYLWVHVLEIVTSSQRYYEIFCIVAAEKGLNCLQKMIRMIFYFQYVKDVNEHV